MSRISRITCLKLTVIFTAAIWISYFCIQPRQKEEPQEPLIQLQEMAMESLFMGPPIHFIMANPLVRSIHPRTACAIESAAFHNLRSQVTLYSPTHLNNDIVSEELQQISNVQIKIIDPRRVLRFSPLLDWYAGPFKKSQFRGSHLRDALRLAILAQKGGVYLDNDIWCIRQIVHLRNSLALEDDDNVNAAVLIFDRWHRFLILAVNQFTKNYKPHGRTDTGGILLTDIIRKRCTRSANDTNLSFIPIEYLRKCLGIKLLPSYTINPIPYGSWKRFFENTTEIFTLPYAIHMWSLLSQNETWVHGSEVFIDKLAKTNCPNIYKLMANLKVI